MSSGHENSQENSQGDPHETSPEVVVVEEKSSARPYRGGIRLGNLRQVPLVNYGESSRLTGETSEVRPKKRTPTKRKASSFAAAEKKRKMPEIPAEEEEEEEEREALSTMTEVELGEIVSDYRLDSRVIIYRLLAEGEVAGSDVSLLVCLFRYMFLWACVSPWGRLRPAFDF